MQEFLWLGRHVIWYLLDLFCSSPASVLFILFSSVCFAFQLAQDTVSDPGVCVADIEAKLYLNSVLRHWQSPTLPEGKEQMMECH